jgi:hypothetical protein
VGRRRPRPPITAREIGAYLVGGYAAVKLHNAALTEAELKSIAQKYAEQDATLAASMGLTSYIQWFVRGYQDACEMHGLCP